MKLDDDLSYFFSGSRCRNEWFRFGMYLVSTFLSMVSSLNVFVGYNGISILYQPYTVNWIIYDICICIQICNQLHVHFLFKSFAKAKNKWFPILPEVGDTNMYPATPWFVHTQTTHPNNMIYPITRGGMKTLAIRSDFDFKFSRFRVLI